ncbi:hypothetical protein ACFFKE_15360 [Streptomyces mutabilis]|uniref:hypothetical protein n=1 Tax=Streptomyces mutabilis TaxID=67332 RepID=UPI0019C9F42F|nr:hypothetical protein [Streptomyces mutabilis]GGQ17074.1 hypothetical protein GCM10010279_26100 [Streptomyces mutabilis]
MGGEEFEELVQAVEVVGDPGPCQQGSLVVDQGDVVVVAGPVDSAGDGHRVVFVLSVGGVLLVAAVRGHASP